MSVGTLEEIIDDNHAIVSTSVGSEHYVSILSFVDKDQLEPGCSVLLNHKVRSLVLNDNLSKTEGIFSSYFLLQSLIRQLTLSYKKTKTESFTSYNYYITV